jgi:hypothetical protein
MSRPRAEHALFSHDEDFPGDETDDEASHGTDRSAPAEAIELETLSLLQLFKVTGGHLGRWQQAYGWTSNGELPNGDKYGVTAWGRMNAAPTVHPSDEERVQQLHLCHNGLDGSFGHWTTCAHLDRLLQLDLRTCRLRGECPPELGGLVALELLKLDGNKNLTGRLPPVQTCRSLRVLSCSRCSFTGRVPRRYARLTKLTTLAVGNNLLTGKVPHDVSRLVNLEVRVVSHCYAVVRVPSLISHALNNNTSASSCATTSSRTCPWRLSPA